jgi:hypothetical protein
MIADTLIPALRERFPESEVTWGTPPNAIAVFPAAHPDVGSLSIWDEGDEVMIAIGDITHGHIGADDEGLSEEQVHEEVAKNVLSFLEDLFAGRVIVWHARRGGAGGWYYAGEAPQGDEVRGCLGRLFRVPRRAKRFVWSGPCK